jgi:hypothetical protein
MEEEERNVYWCTTSKQSDNGPGPPPLAHTSLSALIWQCPPENPMGQSHSPPPAPHVRGLHSLTSELNLRTFGTHR